MKNPAINYVLVGGFVLLMMVAFVGGIAILAGKTASTDRYHTIYSNVAGLKFGTKVSFEGFQIGQVDAIEPFREEGKLKFKVLFSVQEGWQIPEDSAAEVASSGLLASVSVNIRAGISDKMLAPGSFVTGRDGGDLFRSVSALADDVSDLTRTGIQPLIARIGQYVDVMGVALQSAPGVMQDAKTISGNMAEVSPRIAANLERASGEIAAASTRLSTLANDKNVSDIEATLGNLRQMTADLQAASKKLDQAMTSANSIMTDNKKNISQSSEDLRYSMRAVAKRIDSIAGNIESTSRNFSELSRQLRQNPSLLLRSEGPDRGAAR